MPNLFEARTLGKLVQRTPDTPTFILDTFFKNTETFPTKTVEVDFKRGNRRLAPFVHPKVGGKTVADTGYQTTIYTPPLIAPNMITTAEELMNRMAGENPFSGMTPAERAVKKLGENIQDLKEQIQRREEWMAAQAIFEGKIPIKGDGLDEEIDFDFKNKTDAKTLWSSGTADPIADIREWRKQVQKTGMVNCDIMIMASDVVENFLANKKVQTVCDTKAYEIAAIKPQELPNGANFIGHIGEFGMDIYEYNAYYTDDWTEPNKLEEKEMVPAGTIALLSTSATYSQYFGAITIADTNANTFQTIEGEIVPETWMKRNPAARILQLNSRFLPVPNEVDSWLVAKVL